MANKIILSRKGFDSAYGEKPSPILNDGTLLSIPIPNKGDNNDFTDLFYGKQSYYEILSQLKVKEEIKNCECHLDPDIYRNVKARGTNWRACFGQAEGPLTHLESKGVDEGDIFLFFGWFKQTVELNGTISYKYGAKNQHVIFGYLQIGKKVSGLDVDEFPWHPHSCNHYGLKNTIYCAADSLLNTDLPGFGTFKISNELILTKDGYSRSRWELPECLRKVDMTFHDESSRREDYFQSAMIGQEFIMDSTPEIEKWIISIVEKNRVE